MSPLLSHLRGLAVVTAEPPLVPVDAVAELLVDYLRYLIDERGLATSTAQRYVSMARLFLVRHATSGQLHLEDLTARQVSEFVVGECARRRVGSAKCLVVRMRSLLRFLRSYRWISSSWRRGWRGARRANATAACSGQHAHCRKGLSISVHRL